MRIYFARHGESQANLRHEISNRGLRHGLTSNGCAQAQALTAGLEGRGITQIYSSPLLRAIETSAIVAERLGVAYEISQALCEFDCGILEGRSDERAWQTWQELWEAWTIRHDWEWRIEGGESFRDIQGRFEPFIDGLVQQYGDSDINLACVAHGGLYSMMLPVVLKNVSAELVSQYGFDYTACVVAEWCPAGLVCVKWNGHRMDEPGDPAWQES